MKGAGVGDYLAPGQVHIGSVLDLAGRLEPQSVQTIVTSPPYWNLRSYLADDHPDKAKELGNEATPEEFVANLVAVFGALRPALKDSGTLWCNLGDSYANERSWGGKSGAKNATSDAGGYRRTKIGPGLGNKQLVGIPWRMAFALQADGWILRSDLIWSKVNPMPESATDRPTKAHEYIFLLSKSPRYFYDATAVQEPVTGGTHAKGTKKSPPKSLQHEDARAKVKNNRSFMEATWDAVERRNLRSVWDVAVGNFPDSHFATFPPDLIRPCILAGTSERGECVACGRAWVRVVERSFRPMTDRSAAKLAKDSGAKGLDASSRWGDVPRGYTDTETTGWAPQCSCDAPTRPQLILDPFMGSGTTAMVAHEEGRRWIGFDLDERARRWTADRLAKLPVGRLFA
jgi:DNA modification methylase